MRRTQKLLAAQAQAKALGLVVRGAHDVVYKRLEEAGYTWREGKWQQRPGVDMSATKGVADIRIRAANGELIELVQRLQGALSEAGLQIVEMSKPYPDDRHGIAITSRVYIQVKL